METGELYTNPLKIRCTGCGAPTEYDIVRQNYHCGYCGATTELHAPVEALRRYRQKQAHELKAGRRDGQLKKCICPGCGAVVVMDGTEATAGCDFCSTKLVNSKFVDSDSFPELIIPFKLTLDEAKAEVLKWLADNKGKEEAQRLKDRVDLLKGYYLPYRVVKGPVRGEATRARSTARYTYGGFVEEVAVNTSKQLDNLLLEAMEPFDWREIRPFEYGYIAGLHTKLEDASEEETTKRVYREMLETYRPTIEKALMSQDLTNNIYLGEMLQIPALMPVYIINTDEIRCVVNGQTGRVAVAALKETVTHYAWLEPLLLWLFVMGVSLSLPLFLGYHSHLEICLGLGVVVGLILMAAYSGTKSVRKFIHLQSRRQLAKRSSNKLEFADGGELPDNPALKPVFFVNFGQGEEPVEIAFYTVSRAVKAFIIGIVLAFLPNIIAGGIAEMNGVGFFNVHHFYAAAYWTLMIPVVFILYIAVVRRDAFDYPVISRFLPNGKKELVNTGGVFLGLSLKEVVCGLFVPPILWITLFVLFLVLGCVGAILD